MDPSKPIHVSNLGKLEPLPGSPPGEMFWRGSFLWFDGDHQSLSQFYVCSGAEEFPARDVVEFATHIMANIDEYIDAARELLRSKLSEEPGVFGVDAVAAARYLRAGDHKLPFDTPEPTFYGTGDWQIRFAQSSIPECSQLGVSVLFAKEDPVDVENLSGDYEIE